MHFMYIPAGQFLMISAKLVFCSQACRFCLRNADDCLSIQAPLAKTLVQPCDFGVERPMKAASKVAFDK